MLGITAANWFYTALWKTFFVGSLIESYTSFRGFGVWDSGSFDFTVAPLSFEHSRETIIYPHEAPNPALENL